MKRAAERAKEFAGKFAFGVANTIRQILPPKEPTTPTHRDNKFTQGETILQALLARHLYYTIMIK